MHYCISMKNTLTIYLKSNLLFEGSKKKLNDKINLTAVNYILTASKKANTSNH